MTLIFVRHAEAEDREEWAKTCADDGLRPLTKRGKKKMGKAAKGLQKLLRGADLCVSSPLTRALETAEIIGEHAGLEVVVKSELSPGRGAGGLLKWLQKQAGDSTIILV